MNIEPPAQPARVVLDGLELTPAMLPLLDQVARADGPGRPCS